MWARGEMLIRACAHRQWRSRLEEARADWEAQRTALEAGARAEAGKLSKRIAELAAGLGAKDAEVARVGQLLGEAEERIAAGEREMARLLAEHDRRTRTLESLQQVLRTAGLAGLH